MITSPVPGMLPLGLCLVTSPGREPGLSPQGLRSSHCAVCLPENLGGGYFCRGVPSRVQPCVNTCPIGHSGWETPIYSAHSGWGSTGGDVLVSSQQTC